jgi:hypothetical protein
MAGSFIRLSVPVDYGCSFLAALSSKYRERLQGSSETVLLGSSNGSIEVEAVNLDMIRANLSRLEDLKEASLQDVSSIDDEQTIRSTCPSTLKLRYYRAAMTHSRPGIRGLDLSSSLLADWTSVVQLCRALPQLERLSLK